MKNSASKFGILFFLLALTFTKMNAQDHSSLSAQQQSLVKISAYTASGDTALLKVELGRALENGITINEIKETLVQLYAYCGFPRSLNAINTFKNVLDERKAKGIADKEGKPIVTGDATDKYEQGRKVLEMLTQMPQSKPAPGFGEFAPRIDTFLKEHLFADIFASDVLTYQQREFVTIAALASMENVEAQLQAHINIGKNTGISEDQLIELAAIIEKAISITQANTVRKILNQPLKTVVSPDMIIRVSEIEIVPEFLDEYKAILKEEASASVEIETGVIAIFPMYQQGTPTQVRIVEIYANQDAYQKHLQTPHFKHYKAATLKMVKGLKLVDMNGVDKTTMQLIFKKLK